MQPIDGTITVAVNGVITNTIAGLIGGQEYIVAVSTSSAHGTTLSVYNANGLGFIDSNNNPSGIDFGNVVTQIGTNNANGFILTTRGILFYNSALNNNDYLSALQYMASLLNYSNIAPVSMVLPLTWGQCAQPTLNI